MLMLVLWSGFFLFACEEKEEENFLSDHESGHYRLTVDNVRNVEVNTAFNVVAKVKDKDDNPLSEPTTVTLTLEGGRSGARLSGEIQKNMEQGNVTFNNLKIDIAGRNYVLKITLNLDGEEIFAKSNTFTVNDADPDTSDISVGGSLLSIDMAGLPADITAGRALPDLIFTVKIFGNKATGGAVKLKVKNEQENTLMVWRKPVLSTSIRNGEATFPTAFFTQELDTGAKLIAEAAAIVGRKEFSLPQVKDSAVDLSVDSISATENGTELNASVQIDGATCANCRVNSYLVSDTKVKDATGTTTDNAGTFTAPIADWTCAAGVSYKGAVKITQDDEHYYALIHGTCG